MCPDIRRRVVFQAPRGRGFPENRRRAGVHGGGVHGWWVHGVVVQGVGYPGGGVWRSGTDPGGAPWYGSGYQKTTVLAEKPLNLAVLAEKPLNLAVFGCIWLYFA